MAVTNMVYASAVENFFKKQIDLDNDVIKVALLHTYSFSVGHSTWADVKATQITGTNYDHGAGGKVIAHTGGKIDVTDSIISFGKTASDTEWDESTITATHAVVYVYVDDEGSPNDASPLLCCINFDGEEKSASGMFKLEWDSNGIFRATVNPGG